jgi:hypothetical protein
VIALVAPVSPPSPIDSLRVGVVKQGHSTLTSNLECPLIFVVVVSPQFLSAACLC